MMTPRRTRPVVDVSELPDIAFAPNDIMWWGTLSFIVIEGWTLVLCAVAYLYLTQNFNSWPPIGTPRPSLVVPTVQLALMMVGCGVVTWMQQRARFFELAPVKRGLVLASVLNLAFVLLGLAFGIAYTRNRLFTAPAVALVGNTTWLFAADGGGTAAWTLAAVVTVVVAVTVAGVADDQVEHLGAGHVRGERCRRIAVGKIGFQARNALFQCWGGRWRRVRCLQGACQRRKGNAGHHCHAGDFSKWFPHRLSKYC